MIPKIFCINLPHRTDRWEKVQSNFKKFDLNIERFDGVYASSLILPQETKNLWNRDIYHNENSIACSVAHLKLLYHLQSLPDDIFVVIEDDAQPCSNFIERFNRGFLELPKDFEFCFLGGSNLESSTSKFSDNIAISKKTKSTVAYMISKKFILDNIKMIESNILYNVIDEVYCELQQKFLDHGKAFYIYNPRIIHQFESYSDILNKTVYYSFLKDLN